MNNFEKETSIWFNEEDSTANIYTYNKALINRLDRLAKKTEECFVKKVIASGDNSGSKEYVVPKNWINVRPPKKMNLTDEQLQIRMDNLALSRGYSRQTKKKSATETQK